MNFPLCESGDASASRELPSASGSRARLSAVDSEHPNPPLVPR